ncbi:MAG: cadherin domain-containing protein [Bacteroidales bacterium]|nr:cadherin domain-containing protein [Bacteroidales bacterium]
MKNLFYYSLCCFVALFLSFNTYSQNITFSGTISGNTTWDYDTVFINGNVVINNSITLTINSGTIIAFEDNYYFDIDGRILAQGISGDSVKFTVIPGNEAIGWGGFDFYYTSTGNDTSKFEYCVIEYSKRTGEGGVFYIYYFSKLYISNCLITNNHTDIRGGAIYMYYSSPVIINNEISYNDAGHCGGGIWMNQSHPYIYNNIIAYNHSGNRGGGLTIGNYSNPIINNNFICNNSSNGCAGGLRIRCGSKPVLNNNVICNNKSNNNGGGLSIGSYDVVLNNNTICNNYCNSNGGAIKIGCNSGYIPNLTNNIIYGNRAGGGTHLFYSSGGSIVLDRCIVEGGYEGDNFDVDPLFVSPTTGTGDGFDALSADWSLQSSSFGINTGVEDTTTYEIPTTDIAGNPRIYTDAANRIDIGAYEFQSEPSNRAPVIASQYDFRMKPNTTKNKVIQFMDPDVIDLHTIDIQSNTPNLQVINLSGDTTGSTYQLSLLPDWLGSALITLIVTDNSGAPNDADTSEYTVIVSEDTVGGVIDEDIVWCGNVYVAENTFINDGVTLTICSGSTVNFIGDYFIEVYGRLIAEGTSNNKIKFTPEDTGNGWQGIRFNTDNDSSKIVYCTLEYGKANGGSDYNYGGALYINETSNLLIDHCTITNNYASSYGGAIYIKNSSPVITNSTISYNNVNSQGGALYVDSYSNPLIRNNIICNNSSNGCAGGMKFANNSNAWLINNIICNNSSGNSGGGIVVRSPNVKIINNTIANNHAEMGGGIKVGCSSSYDPIIMNNIIYGNDNEQIATAGGDPIVSYSLIEGGYTGTNVFDGNPNFINPSDGTGSSYDGVNANWSVSNSSYAINSGDPDTTGWKIPNKDIKNNPRIYSGSSQRIDVGAIEYQSTPSNRLPLITTIYNKTTNTSTPLTVQVDFDELDENNTHTISVSSDNENIIIDNLTGHTSGSTFDLVPATDWKGTANITVIVTDNYGQVADYNTTIFVLRVGDIYDLCGTISSDLVIDTDILKINCNVTINNGVTLTIAEGTYIEFNGKYRFYVYGRFLSVGTETEPIEFNIAGDYYSQGWNGVYFYNTSTDNDTSKFVHCKFFNGKHSQGGAMYINQYSKVLIDHCEFAYNYASSYGGAIYLNQSSPVITNNNIHHNFSNSHGGGLYIYDNSHPLIQNNTIMNNQAIRYCGGGMRINYYCNPTIINNIIANNESKSRGGGMTIGNNSYPVFLNNTIVNNKSGYGGGIRIGCSSNLTIYNSIFYGNIAYNSSSYNQFYNNSIPTVEFSLVEDGFTGTGNYSYFPGFVNPTEGAGVDYDATLADWTLLSSSSCINTGTPDTTGIQVPDEDFLGNARIYNAERIDVGAVEYQGTPDYYNVNLHFDADTLLPSDRDVRFLMTNTISDGVTLTIPAGAEVLIADQAYLDVEGTILAIGTDTEPISFTTEFPDDYEQGNTSGWHGIRFDNTLISNDSSKFIYCNFSYTNATSNPYNDGGILYMYNFSKVLLDNCTFSNSYVSDDGGAIYLYYADAIITNNTFTNCSANDEGGAIYLYYADAIITNNTFTNCSVNDRGGAIYSYQVFSDFSNNSYNYCSAQYGGGVYLNNSDPDMSQSTFDNNSSTYDAGALFLNYSDPDLTGTQVLNNSSENHGAGFYLDHSYPIIQNSIFENNISENYGGAIYFYYCTSSPIFYNSSFTGNTAILGGGLYFNYSSPVFYDALIAENSAQNGGGIYTYNCSPTFTNSTVANNEASGFGGGAYLYSNLSDPSFTNTIVYQNTAQTKGDQFYLENTGSDPSFNYCDVEGGYKAFEGLGSGTSYNEANYQNSFEYDPLFTGAKTGTYDLEANSYCIDAGTPDTTAMGIPDTDLAENPRVYDTLRIDMGAYELQSNPTNRLPVLTLTGNQTTETNVTLPLSVDFLDVDTADTHTITIVSDDVNLQVQNISGDTTGSTYDLVPVTDWKGTANITVTVKDGSAEVGDYNIETYEVLVGDVIHLCGTISTDSVLDAEIVYVDCNVTVNDGITLTIPAGTYVEFQNNYQMIIYGRLLAEGTLSDSIIFTVPSGNEDIGWANIYFQVDPATNDSSKISYCRFEYGNTGSGGAIYIYNSSELKISNSIFTNNYASSYGGAIYMYRSSPVINNNTFTDNYGYYGSVIYSTDTSSLNFTDNIVSENEAYVGGAIYLSYSRDGQPIITGNTFDYNEATNNAGAIYLEKSNPIIDDNQITNNYSYNNGGAIYTFDTCLIELTTNFIAYNTGSIGGAIYFYSAVSPTVTDNYIIDNHATSSGGAIYNYITNATYTNNLITGNISNADGGAYYLNNSDPIYINNTISNNEAASNGGMMYCDNASPQVINTILWNNTATDGNQVYIGTNSYPDFYYSDIEGGQDDFAGNPFTGDYVSNISGNPKFVDAANDNYQILSTSPCINRGSPNDSISAWGLGLPSTDLAGNARIYGNYRIDIGAYEIQNNPPNDITLSASNIDENASSGTTIGTLSTTDPDGGSFTYTLSESYPDGAYFTINGSTLQSNAVFDYETLSSYSIYIMTDDGSGGTYSKGFLITVNNVNDNSPVIVDNNYTISENVIIGYSVCAVTATDEDINTTLTYSITSGNGDGKFEIIGSTGEIKVLDTLDYETIPTFTIGVSANDGINTGTGTIIINLTDYNEYAPVVSDATLTIPEDTPRGDTIHTVVVTDNDANPTFSYSIAGGNTGNKFRISSATGDIIVSRSLDYESVTQFELSINVYDGMFISNDTITVNITNVNDNKPVIKNETVNVYENLSLGSLIHTISATDADEGTTLSYIIIDGNEENKFTINSSNGEITLLNELSYDSTRMYFLDIIADDGLNTGNGVIAIVVLEVPVGIDDEINLSGISLYPNPNNGIFTITVENHENQDMAIEIQNIAGKTLIRENVKYLSNKFIKQFDLSKYAKGIYLIKLTIDDKATDYKIIIE